MATQLQKLIAALRGGGQSPAMPPSMPPSMPPGGQPQPVPQMGGLAGQGQGIIQAQQAYKQYYTDTAGQGGNPVSFEQFVQGAR